MQLDSLVKSSDYSKCLKYTVQCLKTAGKAIEDLENSWLRLLNEQHLDLSNGVSSKAIIDINEHLFAILSSNNVKVKDALLLTSKLCIIYSRTQESVLTSSSGMYVPQTLACLRSKIKEFIPEDATLDFKYYSTFGKILPLPTDPNFPFYSRLLSSFVKLCEDKNTVALRLCTEYLSRKKFKLPLPTNWPSPNEGQGNGDPDWFLWGFYLCYYSDNPIVNTNFQLYLISEKSKKQGFLWGLPYCIEASTDTHNPWDKKEQRILSHISNMVGELWGYDAFKFMPRSAPQHQVTNEPPTNFELQRKIINI